MNGKREYGDYQTPLFFAKRVCDFLKNHRHINPTAVLEPTCGIGNFLKASLIFDANEYYGIEIDPKYCAQCSETIKNSNVKIINSDFFTFSPKQLIKDDRRVLIIGNPPWVTNSALSSAESDNIPAKSNIKMLNGIDAITGSSNFDICESIILSIIGEYNNTNAVISMLCKTSVARNVFKELKRNSVFFESCEIFEFDASLIFGVNTNACILLIRLSDNLISSDHCNVFDFDTPEEIKSRLEYSNGRLFNALSSPTDDFDGQCNFEWRQGVKHDCSKIMELTMYNGEYKNAKNVIVNIEDNIVFPLIKSSMFKTPVIHNFSKYVIVTQKKIKEETSHLKNDVPKTWNYLIENIKLFENRKSAVYKNAPPFSMFGIGDYSYSKYKVGVSGFYKSPLFSVLYSDDKKPVMTDDTSYFICFDNYDMAYVAMLLLNSERVQTFIKSIAFLDSKRPYTKKVLDRIDFDKIANVLTIEELIQTEQNLNLSCHVTLSMYKSFKSLLNSGQIKFSDSLL